MIRFKTDSKNVKTLHECKTRDLAIHHTIQQKIKYIHESDLNLFLYTQKAHTLKHHRRLQGIYKYVKLGEKPSFSLFFHPPV